MAARRSCPAPHVVSGARRHPRRLRQPATPGTRTSRSSAALLDAPVDVVFTSDAYGAELARRLGRHLGAGRPGPARRRRSPAARSGPTRPRYWWALPAAVRAWFVRRVVVLGAESTGTTTLAEDLTAHFGLPTVAEFGREWSAEPAGRPRRAVAHRGVRPGGPRAGRAARTTPRAAHPGPAAGLRHRRAGHHASGTSATSAARPRPSRRSPPRACPTSTCSPATRSRSCRTGCATASTCGTRCRTGSGEVLAGAAARRGWSCAGRAPERLARRRRPRRAAAGRRLDRSRDPTRAAPRRRRTLRARPRCETPPRDRRHADEPSARCPPHRPAQAPARTAPTGSTSTSTSSSPTRDGRSRPVPRRSTRSCGRPTSGSSTTRSSARTTTSSSTTRRARARTSGSATPRAEVDLPTDQSYSSFVLLPLLTFAVRRPVPARRRAGPRQDGRAPILMGVLAGLPGARGAPRRCSTASRR